MRVYAAWEIEEVRSCPELEVRGLVNVRSCAEFFLSTCQSHWRLWQFMMSCVYVFLLWSGCWQYPPLTSWALEGLNADKAQNVGLLQMGRDCNWNHMFIGPPYKWKGQVLLRFVSSTNLTCLWSQSVCSGGNLSLQSECHNPSDICIHSCMHHSHAIHFYDCHSYILVIEIFIALFQELRNELYFKVIPRFCY